MFRGEHIYMHSQLIFQRGCGGQEKGGPNQLFGNHPAPPIRRVLTAALGDNKLYTLDEDALLLGGSYRRQAAT